MQEDRRSHPEKYLTDDAQADLWLELGETLAGLGFLHYEISNWARPGREARHNVKYWKRVPTLGLGVAAHEFWGERRRANTSVLAQYVEALEAAGVPRRATFPLVRRSGRGSELSSGCVSPTGWRRGSSRPASSALATGPSGRTTPPGGRKASSGRSRAVSVSRKRAFFSRMKSSAALFEASNFLLKPTMKLTKGENL